MKGRCQLRGFFHWFCTLFYPKAGNFVKCFTGVFDTARSPPTRGSTPATSTTTTVASTRGESFSSQWNPRWFKPPCRPKPCPVKTKVRHHTHTRIQSEKCERLGWPDVGWFSGFWNIKCPKGSSHTHIWSFLHMRWALQRAKQQQRKKSCFWGFLFVTGETLFLQPQLVRRQTPWNHTHMLSHSPLQNLTTSHLYVNPLLSIIFPLQEQYRTLLVCFAAI